MVNNPNSYLQAIKPLIEETLGIRLFLNEKNNSLYSKDISISIGLENFFSFFLKERETAPTECCFNVTLTSRFFADGYDGFTRADLNKILFDIGFNHCSASRGLVDNYYINWDKSGCTEAKLFYSNQSDRLTSRVIFYSLDLDMEDREFLVEVLGLYKNYIRKLLERINSTTLSLAVASS